MEKIFISIASYRDSELIRTVKNIIDSAKHPQLLKIVVFEQNGPDDISISGIYPTEQVLVISTGYENAKGPLWARYIIQQYYNNEEYYLQIDSHSRMIQDWDSKLKEMLQLCPEPAVLTNYPSEYSLYTNELDSRVRTGLYIQGFGKEGFTRIQSSFSKDNVHFPYTCKGWSACFSFSKGNIVKDAPYDPDLTGLFFGEELDISIRLYTRGWYFFSPHEVIIYTCFKRNHRRTYWQDIPEYNRKILEEKARKILDDKITSPKFGKFGIGNTRTVDEYMKFAEIEDYKLKKMKKNAKTFRKYTTRKIYR